jgi:hypothetical protein
MEPSGFLQNTCVSKVHEREPGRRASVLPNTGYARKFTSSLLYSIELLSSSRHKIIGERKECEVREFRCRDVEVKVEEVGSMDGD